ncbi:MAG: glycine/betaine/sarcosine/D-proline family reductase selenoprotein B, partial [Candidatus Tectomicrobia bacterium]|nr:glycine/betaine/sarcosine/D-proline family reductase selenoprotein B [Candidatus Tectomicrobia bacterium]
MSTNKKVRVVHYVNQFFAGVGGEEKGDHPLTLKEGPVGPGLLLQRLLGAEGEVVGTLSCGDNAYAADPAAEAAALKHIERLAPDLLVAGPAFNAGRYGLACASLCLAVKAGGKTAVVTGMYHENPGVSACRRHVHIVPTGDSAGGMGEALPRMARLGLKLARGEKLGPAQEEGYLPRGVRYNGFAEVPAAQRAVDLVLKKVRREPFASEFTFLGFDRVSPPAPLKGLKGRRIAVVTEAGMVPPGNPDRIPGSRASATHWNKYSLGGLEELPKGSFISIHGGYNNLFVNEDPDR